MPKRKQKLHTLRTEQRTWCGRLLMGHGNGILSGEMISTQHVVDINEATCRTCIRVAEDEGMFND